MFLFTVIIILLHQLYLFRQMYRTVSAKNAVLTLELCIWFTSQMWPLGWSANNGHILRHNYCLPLISFLFRIFYTAWLLGTYNFKTIIQSYAVWCAIVCLWPSWCVPIHTKRLAPSNVCVVVHSALIVLVDVFFLLQKIKPLTHV